MTAADRIRARIAKQKKALAAERTYIRHRVRERDHHGTWDSAIACAEWEIEIAALKWALKQMEPPRP